MSDYPADLRYSVDHEWVRPGEGSTVRVGITFYAADALGDIVYAALPFVGDTVSANDSVAELESTKSVSEVFTPVSGVICAVNEALSDAPETINADPYGAGWLFEVELADAGELAGLLDATGYVGQLE